MAALKLAEESEHLTTITSSEAGKMYRNHEFELLVKVKDKLSVAIIVGILWRLGYNILVRLG